MVYHNIYYHVALQSSGTFKQLVKIIPDLYRWFKQPHNRAIIVRHFIYKRVHYNHDKLITEILFDGKLHSINDEPSYIVIWLNIDENERLKKLSKLEINNIDYTRFSTQNYITYRWYTNNILTRDNDAPAFIRYGLLYNKKIFIYNKWYSDDKKHRNNGPATIYRSLSFKNRWKVYEEYYKNNIFERDSKVASVELNNVKEELDAKYLFIYNESVFINYLKIYDVKLT